MNRIVEAYYLKNKQYGKTHQRDVLYYYPDYQRQFSGICDTMLRLIQSRQLEDESLWPLFVNQFKTHPDPKDNGWRGEYWGKMMRGACLTYQYSRDEKLYAILTETVKDMLTAQDADGRFSTYTKEAEFRGWDMWCRKYVMLGLLHYHEICRDEALRGEIVTALCKHLDYIISKIGEGKLDITQTSDIWEGVNSSSVLEPVMRLYHLTGKQNYLDFATYIVNRGGADSQNIFQTAYEGKLYPYQYKVVKAYELMSCFEGLCEYYRATGIEKWKQAVIRFWDMIRETDITIIGCAGCMHELFDHSAVRQTDTSQTLEMQETCVAVTWMKLCAQLLSLTGEAKYADEMERSAYNTVFGSVNTMQSKHNNGLPFDSYSPLWLRKRGVETGGMKEMENGARYGCCAAIGSAGTALLPDLACMSAQNGMVINFYENGIVTFPIADDNSVKLTIETAYPADGKIKITVEPEREEIFDIGLRIPGFGKTTELTVNGVKSACAPGSFKTVSRAWKQGDVLELHLDMAAYIVHAPGCADKPETRDFVAVTKGPLVLARDARICPDAGRAVRVKRNADVVMLQNSHKASFDTVCEYEADFCGEKTTLIDYMSAGKTWDDDSATEAWLPAEFIE